MRINWRHELIDYYIDKLQRSERFAAVGYSDAEWFSIIRFNIEQRTGAGQLLNASVGDLLFDIIRRRHGDGKFMLCVPDCIWNDVVFTSNGVPQSIEKRLSLSGISEVTFYERDGITDNLAMNAGLFPLIQAIRSRHVVLIGNQCMNDLRIFQRELVEVSFPNQHLNSGKIKSIQRQCVDLCQGDTLFLFSAGMSSALIIDGIYDKCPQASFLDCGSMWDAFVGIGCQREWRRQLYMDPEKMASWRYKNLHG